MNRSARASTGVPARSPLIVFGRPCKACGFGCTTGLDAGACKKFCGEEEYGGCGGIKSSSEVPELETGVGGIDSGRELVVTTWRIRSLGSLDEPRAEI